MGIRYITSSTAYQDLEDRLINCNCTSAAVNFNLSKAANCKEFITVKKVDGSGNKVKIIPFEGETIDGGASLELTYNREYVTLAPVSGGWGVIDRFVGSAIMRFGEVPAVLKADPAKDRLTLAGAVKHGESITLGDSVFVLAADEAQAVPAGASPIDISSDTVAANGTLTIGVNPTAGDKMTIGTTVYTFVATEDFNSAGQIPAGVGVANTRTSILAAINGTDGINPHHALVKAGSFTGSNSTITALAGGTAGNSIATTSDFTSGSNSFAKGTLQNGADCDAADAVKAIASAIQESPLYFADVESSNMVGLGSKFFGTAANGTITSTTIANASFENGELTGGIDPTPGEPGELRLAFGAAGVWVYLALPDEEAHSIVWGPVITIWEEGGE